MICFALLVFLITAVFLSWGSFLNVVAFRLLYCTPFFASRSQCPHCSCTIAWYDLIPVLSWLILRGQCRSCKGPISWLYPCIELITALSLWALIVNQQTFPFFWGYALFFSALIVTLRTDIEALFILRYASVGIIPCALLLSACGLLPITLMQSVTGSLFGYALLWIARAIFLRITGKIGIGQGDLELLAGIGAFLGIIGCWLTLVLGSAIGSVVSLIFILTHRKASPRQVPFGAFLALAALLVTVFQQQLISLLLL